VFARLTDAAQGDVAGLDTACLAQLGPSTFDLTLPNN
jgi:hypothetical protein